MDYDEEQVREVYAHFGLAMYLAQVLEHGVVNALVILRLPAKAKMTRQDIDEFMEGRFQKTLGALLRQQRSEIGSIPGELDSVLRKALRERDFLAHHYFRERSERFVLRDGREQMLQELQGYQKLFEDAEGLLSQALAPFRIRYGVTDEVLDEEYERVCRSLGIDP